MVKKGNDYEQLPKIELLLITPFELVDKGTNHNYLMKEREKGSIYSEKMQIRTFEIKKPKTEEQKKLCELLTTEDLEVVRKYKKDKKLGGIAKMIESFNFNEEEYIKEFMAEIAYLDQKSLIKTAQAEGMEEGIEEGKRDEKRNIAKKLLKKGIDRNTIIEITGLSNQQLNSFSD